VCIINHFGGLMVRIQPPGFFVVFCLTLPILHASITPTPSLSPASPQLVGTPVTITFGATDSGPGPVNYRLDVAPPGGSFQTVHDFNLLPAFVWAQSLVEGTYQLRVTARDNSTGDQNEVVIPYTITSRVTSGNAVVTATSNPLVALFSAPACPVGSTMQIFFYPQGKANVSSATDNRPCGAGTSMNFLIAGMYPSTIYEMNYLVDTNGTYTRGPQVLQFTTGALPSGSPKIMTSWVKVQASSATSEKEKIQLTSYFAPYAPSATDLAGNLVWYYSGNNPSQSQVHRMAPLGTTMDISGGPNSTTGSGLWGAQVEEQLVQQVDLAGNVIRETNVDRVNEQLPIEAAISNFDHDAILLPNGHILVIATNQRVFPAGTQGNSAAISVIGRVLLDLDTNMQVAWYWNAFDHDSGGTQLNIARPATMGETCAYNANDITPWGCPPVLLTSPANDWLHGNSIQYEPDGSIMMSLRHQDWVVDIDYNNGTGTGNIVWIMGLDGNFTMQTTSNRYPWFSHEHNVEFTLGGMTSLTLFDNGNTRISQDGGYSRGMVLNVDVPNRTVAWSFVPNMGVFSQALGSAQLLSNGDYMFLCGDILFKPSSAAAWDIDTEYSTNGTLTYSQGANFPAYRAFRVPNLYSPPNGGGVNQSNP